VSGLVLLVATAFVLSSAWQLTRAVFLNSPPSGPADPRLVRCSERLRPLASALDRAADHASAQLEAASAMRAFDAALDPEWQGIGEAERICGESPAGAEAYASLLRLRRGLEGHARRAVSDIGPLRRDFEARLR
jgi:hypothetical protein